MRQLSGDPSMTEFELALGKTTPHPQQREISHVQFRVSFRTEDESRDQYELRTMTPGTSTFTGTQTESSVDEESGKRQEDGHPCQ